MEKEKGNGFERERKVGIECYMNQAKGIVGVHKYRFSDFVVQEVSMDKEIAYL